MHSAPAVSYPVGRSRFHGGLLLLITLTGLLVGLLWLAQADLAGWRQALFAITLLVLSLVATRAWLNAPRGQLEWDGLVWRWTRDKTSVYADLRVHFDFQVFLVLSLSSPSRHARIWLWPERHACVAQWDALRRAVFSQVKS